MSIKNCKHKNMKPIYTGSNIAIGCDKKNKPLQILDGVWTVYVCSDCGYPDIPDVRIPKRRNKK